MDLLAAELQQFQADAAVAFCSVLLAVLASLSQDEQWQLEGKLRNSEAHGMRAVWCVCITEAARWDAGPCEAQEPILRARAEEAQAQVLEAWKTPHHGSSRIFLLINYW